MESDATVTSSAASSVATASDKRQSRFDSGSGDVEKRSPSPVEIISEEERQARMVRCCSAPSNLRDLHAVNFDLVKTVTYFALQLLAMRKMLTEVLLTVTSEEIEDVAREVIAKEKTKAAKGSIHA